MLQLRYEELGVPVTHAIKEGLSTVGRLPSSDLVLNDSSVSRRHAVIRFENGRCFLQDSASRFGTFLNDRRLVAVDDEVEVVPGSQIKFGEVAASLDQFVPEGDLLTENHEVAEGPGTIFKSVVPEPASEESGDGRLLRLLAEVGRSLLTLRSLSDTLNRVVDLAFGAVPAERAFLMLRDSADEALSARVLRHRDGSTPANPTLSRMVVRRVMRERVAMLGADATTDPGLGITDSILRFNIRSFMCAPLWNREDVIGVLYVDSPRSGQFTPADLDAFTALTNAAAVAIEQARLSNQLVEETRRRERLQRYHSPSVVSRIVNMSDAQSGLEAQERDVSVMFCDLVGFTTLCEKISPVQSAALLNAFLTRMTDIVFEHEGTLDKFLGDALLAFWGAPFDQPLHALRSIEAAVAMRKALVEMNARPDAPQLEMRIAINSGIALTGDIGSVRRREFTVLGDVVNTASRIEDAVAAPGDIVISAATYEHVKGQVTVRALGARQLRGRQAPLEVYAVED
jgi:adenylate cyclase